MQFVLLKKILIFVLCLSLLVPVCGCAKSTEESEIQTGNMTDETSQIFTMGTVFTVRSIADENARDALLAAEDILNSSDRLLSWRQEGSAADVFNRTHQADVSEIADLIEISLQVSRDSGGAYDMTILPLSQLWQFDKMEEEDFNPEDMIVPEQDKIETAESMIDYRKLQYDADSGILSTEDPALKIELGAIGKGWAIDKALSAMESSGVSGAMISAGSSIGLLGTKEDGSLFKVALRDPRGELSDYLGILTVSDCSISTSGDYERYFEKDGIRYHHILDPDTGYPADSGLMQVTVIGESGTLGDALSTACFVLGLEDGMKLANKYNVLAIFVDNDKNVWYNNSDVLDILEIVSKGYTMHEYNQKAE